MKSRIPISAILWIAVALLLVAAFNVWPKLAAFPTALVLIPALAILAFNIYRGTRNRTLSWNRKVYRQITVKHLLLSALGLLFLPFVWMALVLRLVRNNPEQLLVIVIIPAIVVISLGGICVGVALYYAHEPTT